MLELKYIMIVIRQWLEKPFFIWFWVSCVYVALFMGVLKDKPFTESESATVPILIEYTQSSFPPKIELIKNLPDWGHAGYYALTGGISKLIKANTEDKASRIRFISLVFMLLAFLKFVRLGFHYSYSNRLNPFWISLALIIFAANPYAVFSASQLSFVSLFLFLTLAALFYFEKENFKYSSIFISLAILVDWRALILAVVFVVMRFLNNQSKIVRAERGVALVAPFAVAAIQLMAWKGVVPLGTASEWWGIVREQASFFQLDAFFYFVLLVPIYTLFFSWSWGFRARMRALKIGAILTVVFVPFYFLFPIQFEFWSRIHLHVDQPLGLVDQAAYQIANEYKNLLLFIPWVAGIFLFFQFLLKDMLDQSRGLWLIILFFFLIQPIISGMGAMTGDAGFFMVLPYLLLFTLAEAIVGEEGKLA